MTNIKEIIEKHDKYNPCYTCECCESCIHSCSKSLNHHEVKKFLEGLEPKERKCIGCGKCDGELEGRCEQTRKE
jgi:hypothetical protein